MKHCYINGMGCVSTQDTSSYITFLETYSVLKESVTKVHKPTYRNFIKPAMIRRMAAGVKNGVVAANIALKEAAINNPDAIITGTGMGCLIDSEKFLANILKNDEQFLTPTSFIQSTHNTVGGQIALGLKCKSYNVTYVHNATSFESSLIDALLMINDGEENVLVGGVDEIGEQTTNMFKLIKHIKQEENITDILKSKTDGAIHGEGAQFFSLSNKRTANSYAELVDITIYDSIEKNKITEKLIQFLTENNLIIDDLDLVVLGNNGDVIFDSIYTDLQNSVLKNTPQIYYKHLSGEYHTASSFGLWIASNICKTQEIPKFLKLNTKENTSIKNVLLYNQYRNESHSFTLIKSC